MTADRWKPRFRQDDELMRASEAIIRSAHAPQPRPQVQATASGDRETAEQVDRAA